MLPEILDWMAPQFLLFLSGNFFFFLNELFESVLLMIFLLLELKNMTKFGYNSTQYWTKILTNPPLDYNFF